MLALQVDRAKVLSNTIKQKRKQKAGKWEVPLPKVFPLDFCLVLWAWSCTKCHLGLLRCHLAVKMHQALSANKFHAHRRCGLWQRMRCSRCCTAASARRSNGSAW